MRKTLTAASVVLLLTLLGCGGGSFSTPFISRDHQEPLAVPTSPSVPVTRESGTTDFCSGGILDKGADLGTQGPDLVITAQHVRWTDRPQVTNTTFITS